MLINNTILAFLLALQDFPDSLSKPETEVIGEIAQDLECHRQPEVWEKNIKPKLLKLIQANERLDSSYKNYREQLILKSIPLEILPKKQDINNLLTDLQKKGFHSDKQAEGYGQQLENVMMVVGKSEDPKDVVKKLSFLNKVKAFLTSSEQ